MLNHRAPTQLEADWQTEAGLRAFVLLPPNGCRTAYVVVPPRRPWHGVPWQIRPDDRTIVHGGVTYSDPAALLEVRPTGVTPRAWLVGFDAGHKGDGITRDGWAAYDNLWRIMLDDAPDVTLATRSLSYMRAECERLAGWLEANKP